MDVDDFAWLIRQEDLDGIESARRHVTPEVLEDLVWLYWRLSKWLHKCLLINLLQDHWDPGLFTPVMLDMLRAPTDWHDEGLLDQVHWAQAVALAYVDERYDKFDTYWSDRDALRAAVEQARRERGITADTVADEPKAWGPYADEPVARLEQACKRGDIDTVLAALDSGLDVDTPLSLSTPMMHAVIRGHLDLALRLLERGASVRARWPYTGTTVLIRAAAHGHVPLIDAAVNRGASPDEAQDSGVTALYNAVSHGRLDAVRRLLDAGASVGTSPLFVAAAGGGHLEVAELLLAAGCGLEEVTSDGHTALAVAARSNEADAVDFLLAKGAAVDTRDASGRTPLMEAATRGCSRIVDRLLRAGADPSATDAEGRTARDLVGRRRTTEVLALLENTPKRGSRPWRGELLGFEYAYDEGRAARGGWPCAADCPGTATLLVAIHLVGVPHNRPGHNVNYGYTFLAVCTTCGTGRLETLDHDCWNDHEDEPWDLARVYTVTPEGVERVRVALRDCPQPENYACDCAVHAMFRESSSLERLLGDSRERSDPRE
ncbi:ankyrin repeat domain-containing protein [Lentzea sp. NBRC 105346]|uniref:ankyrin repeat domain-containing protein n=1 Tax=Lentzea sp. NBRC 105346 TaxID=3032205 RepID=UPI00255423E4|nr:ankyrin repeat domain-containing protein [Lentzea sp. NBRC 105346]